MLARGEEAARAEEAEADADERERWRARMRAVDPSAIRDLTYSVMYLIAHRVILYVMWNVL